MNYKHIAQQIIEANEISNFWHQKPVPNIVVDNFLPKSLAKEIEVEAQNYKTFIPTNDYMFGKNKFGSHDLDSIGKGMSALKGLLVSEIFAAALSQVFGQKVFVDNHFIGGGLHRGGKGSYLDMHVDFKKHPSEEWIRELNVLYFLNPEWKKAFGGALKLENSETGKCGEIEPLFNRLVIMHTSDYTYHGYSTIDFPDGRFRTSIAAYSYRLPMPGEDITSRRTTTIWRPSSKFRSLVAMITPALVQAKQKVFGSRTARQKK